MLINRLNFFLTLFYGTVFASSSPPGSSLEIKTSIGSFQGFNNATTNLDVWLGVPFAQPPVGQLRFKPPVAITKPFSGVQQATSFGSACPQPVSSSTQGVSISEDCLFLNIFRPAGTSFDAKLPVLVWFYGGGYNTGAASDPQFNPAFLISRSVAMGKPIMFVSVNYRVNTFGFLSSAHVNPADLNNGLRDQTQALRFVQAEISSFGGDPEKVTIWGQSVGGGSVETHVLFPDKETLFRAGILDSSTGPYKSAPFAAQYDEPGKPFSRLVQMVGCSEGPQSVECLRDVPFITLLNASNTLLSEILNQQVWEPTPGGQGNLITERASDKIASGNFLRVPLLWGTNLNEGTTFSKSVLGLRITDPNQQNARFGEFIGQLILDNRTLTQDVLDEIYSLYPSNDTSLGGPFRTGDQLFDRAEAWYTDNMYLAPRRLFFNEAASKQKLFAYFFREFIPGNNITNGVFHGIELQLIFGQSPPSESSLANAFTDAYVNFVNDLNPGSFWPQYDLNTKPVLQWMKDNITVIPDDFNLAKTEFLNSKRVLNEFEK